MSVFRRSAGRFAQRQPRCSFPSCLVQRQRNEVAGLGGATHRVRNDTERCFSTGASPSATDVRGSFQEYWNTDHSSPTLESMMLDSDASTMDRLERPEILSALPSLKGKRILELGAGIGRFSGLLAEKAESVVAVDFVESSCDENRRLNAACDNLNVMHADVTFLDLEPESFDLIFSNWLLMYLTDDEVKAFAQNVMKWLRPGGQLFFRESCFHSSGDATRRFNPTQYRNPEQYSQMFSEATSEDGSKFQLRATNCLESYASMKGNMHQMWFRWKKLTPKESERAMLLLQTGQYTPANCLRYEKIYGKGYVNTGGDDVSKRLLDESSDWLRKGARCLTFGNALEGQALYFANQRPDIYIHSVNQSGELYSFVSGRHVSVPKSVRERVTFGLAPENGIPENELSFPPNSYDVVILREAMMYLPVHDKAVLLQKIFRLLRPGGRLLVVDYSVGKPWAEIDPEFKEYLDTSGYFLTTPEEQKEDLSRYFDVQYSDATEQFVGFMDDGLSKIEEHFGASAPARLAVKQHAAKPLDTSQEQLAKALRALVPGPPDNIISEAADAAMYRVQLHRLSEVAVAEACERDCEWANSGWLRKKVAALRGDLRWSFFFAVKSE